MNPVSHNDSSSYTYNKGYQTMPDLNETKHSWPMTVDFQAMTLWRLVIRERV